VVVELRQLNLELALGGLGVLREDVEDQAGTVDDLDLVGGERVDPRQVLEVAALGRSARRRR